MSSRLRDNINSQYVRAANAMTSKQARRRIVAYVESYDDIYFWRTVLSQFEDEHRYFEVMLPSKIDLTRGKKSVLMNFLSEGGGSEEQQDGSQACAAGCGRLGSDMIACVDADYDYLLQGCTRTSQQVLDSPYVFHTYVYAIENYQCYAPSLHDVCVAVTLNDHRIFDFTDYLRQLSEIIFPLFVWSVWAYRTGNYPQFTLTDFSRITDPGGFTVQHPEASLQNVRHKVHVKISELQRKFPGNKEAYLKLKDEIKALGVTPQTTYLYIQGHHLFDTIVAPILGKVCHILQQERQNEIQHARAHHTQKRNEMSCYENSRQDIKAMLKKNTGYAFSEPFRRLQADVRRYIETALTVILLLFVTLVPARGAGAGQNADSLPLRSFTVRGVDFNMVRVEHGRFQMGSNGYLAYDDERPAHTVVLTSDYYLGQTEVTQALWQAVMNDNPSSFRGDSLPVEQVTWNDCQTFISRLNELTGQQFRLPSEAEWEYAARGGLLSRCSTYSGSDVVDEVAWYVANSGVATHAVATLQPNELGIYDMGGNVWEWCQDWYHAGYYASAGLVVTNPIGPDRGKGRVARGGGWRGGYRYCRVSYRNGCSPAFKSHYLGLRLAL